MSGQPGSATALELKGLTATFGVRSDRPVAALGTTSYFLDCDTEIEARP
jgi:hypothetical protein